MEGETDFLRERANQNGIDFLLFDLDLANTFLDVAAAFQSKETASRNHSNARKAYDTVMRLMPKLRLDQHVRQDFNRKLSLSEDSAAGHWAAVLAATRYSLYDRWRHVGRVTASDNTSYRSEFSPCYENCDQGGWWGGL